MVGGSHWRITGRYAMAIGMAVQKGRQVYVYDERNHQIFVLSGELHGYTSGTVSVRIDRMIYTHDEKRRQVGATSAK